LQLEKFLVANLFAAAKKPMMQIKQKPIKPGQTKRLKCDAKLGSV
jgi:hypothetical protein